MIFKSSFIGQTIDNINNHYEIGDAIGEGAYGKVYSVTKKITGRKYACKIVEKINANRERLFSEIKLLKSTDHPNIVKLYELIEDQEYLYMIMELCQGNNLLQRMISRSKEDIQYSEKEACAIFKQLISAVNYCHIHGVCHRDIKPENILFSSNDEHSSIKLVDFGLSRTFTIMQRRMFSCVGTIYYNSPEVLMGCYDEKCDIWSCGCILYTMICGRLPFYSMHYNTLWKKIVECNYNFNYAEFDDISNELIDLIKNMLCFEKQRLTADQVLKHNWVVKYSDDLKNSLLCLNIRQMINFSQMDKIQQCLYSGISNKLPENQNICKLFNAFDTDSNGIISLGEFVKGINFITENKKETPFPELNSLEIENIFKGIDLDKNGLISHSEFVTCSCNYKNSLSEKEFKDYASEAFRTQKYGFICFNEIIDVIRLEEFSDLDVLKKCFDKYDKNKDGLLDLDEFFVPLDG